MRLVNRLHQHQPGVVYAIGAVALVVLTVVCVLAALATPGAS